MVTLQQKIIDGSVRLNPTQIKFTPRPREPTREAEALPHDGKGISKSAAQIQFTSLILLGQVQSAATADGEDRGRQVGKRGEGISDGINARAVTEIISCRVTGKAHAPYCHLWPLWLHHIFHIISQMARFSKKRTLLNIKCVF